MKRSFLWMSCITLILFVVSCREHECPELIQNVSLRNADISDVMANSYLPALSRAGDGRLQTSAWTYSGNYGAGRTFLNFNLSSIPQGSTILKAELTMYADTTNYTNATVVGHSQLTGTNEWKVKQVTSDWTESTLVWNNRPTYDLNNANAISMSVSASNSQTYVIDITEFIQKQLDHPDLYFGVMFQLDTEVEYRMIAFCAKEHPYASTLAPTLNISYLKR